MEGPAGAREPPRRRPGAPPQQHRHYFKSADAPIVIPTHNPITLIEKVGGKLFYVGLDGGSLLISQGSENMD